MHQPHNILHYLHNKELNELYVSIAIRSFALSLVTIFIPVYLLQLGYSLTSVLIFFSFLAGAHALGALPASKIASRYGFKHSILFSIPLLIVFYLLLYSLEDFAWSLYMLGIIYGFSTSLFWVGYHSDFAKFSDKKNRGKEVGIGKIVGILAHVLGPIIGGFALVFLGFKLVFVAVSVLLLLSAVPLFMSKDVHQPISLSLKGFFKGRKIKDSIAMIGFGFEHGVALVIWPIFIFFNILGEQYTSLGGVASLGLFFASIFIIVIGKISDKHRRLVLKIGAVSNSIVWVVKSFVQTVFQVFVIDAIYGLTKITLDLPFEALTYDKANKRKDGILKSIAYREFMINAGRTAFFVIMIFISDYIAGFIIGGTIGSLLHIVF